MYNPYRQVTPFFTGSLVARITGAPATVVAGIRDIVGSMDPNQPIDNIATMNVDYLKGKFKNRKALAR